MNPAMYGIIGWLIVGLLHVRWVLGAHGVAKYRDGDVVSQAMCVMLGIGVVVGWPLIWLAMIAAILDGQRR